MKIIGLILCCVITSALMAQDFTSVYAKVEKSVVPIFTLSESTGEVGGKIQKTASQGLGSGAVISKSGLILTASHVVNDAKNILVEIDEEHYTAKIIRNSVNADVALIKLDLPPDNLEPLKLGDSDDVRIGEQIFVVGFPHGLGKTFTEGYIGGRHVQKKQFSDLNDIEMFQTDASINSGNSGGPIFNMKGEIIGVVSSILTKSGGFEGVGFAATINIAKDHLIKNGNLWIGMNAILISDAFAAVLNIPAKGGILVQNVVEKSPAYFIGLRGGYLPVQVMNSKVILGGDVILQIEGLPCSSDQEVEIIQSLLKQKKSGEKIKLLILREGEKKELVWTIKRESLELD